MPLPRRMRLVGLLFFVFILVILYMSNSADRTQSSDFYTKTQEALQAREYEAAARQRDADDVGTRLKAAEEAAKHSTDQNHQKYMDSVDGSGSNERTVAGRVRLGEQNGDKKNVPGVAGVGGRPVDIHAAKSEEESQEEHDTEVELNSILKKSPIIIFSKSYCPHSKQAKYVLLDKYEITPAPYVVELDQHPLGPSLQATLGQSTGRKTVPNVLLMGKSIGGGDDILELDMDDKLIDTIKKLGGSRITEIKRRDSSNLRSEIRKLKA